MEPRPVINVNVDDLPGMPEKEEATLIAERILVLKEKLAALREELTDEKSRFVNEMRAKQQSSIVVNGFEFEVELEDKVTIKKKKSAF